jgi:hypothetical protein
MLEREYAFYQEHKENLKRDYLNKYIVIKDAKVLGAYDSKEMALSETIKTEEMGSFLVQKVSQDDEQLVQRFYSRVRLNAVR